MHGVTNIFASLLFSANISCLKIGTESPSTKSIVLICYLRSYHDGTVKFNIRAGTLLRPGTHTSAAGVSVVFLTFIIGSRACTSAGSVHRGKRRA